MNKVCAMCKVEKGLEEFSNKLSRSGKAQKQPYCKPCNREYHKQHYQNNKKEYLQKNKNYAKENKQRLLQYLRQHDCKDCGTKDYRVFEFDHLRDKKFGISTKIKSLCWETLLTEIEKCEIVCCNCHRIRTLTRSKSYRTAP